MKLHFSISQADYLQFLIHHTNNSKIINTNRSAYYLPVIFMLTIVGSEIFKGTLWQVSPVRWAIYLGCGIAYTILSNQVWSVINKRNSKRLLTKYIAENNITGFLGAQTLELKDDCLESVTEAAITQTLYKSIERIETANNFYYIYSSANVQLVPYSATDSDQFIRQLKQTAHIN